MMNFNFSVSVDPLSTVNRVNFLTKDDAKSPSQYVRDLQNAIDSGSLNAIKTAARDLLNNEKRNAKIERHEQQIEGITQLILANTEINAIVSRTSITAALEHTGAYCETHHRRYIAPVGATTVALRRLCEAEIFLPSVGLNENGNLTKVYIRVK